MVWTEILRVVSVGSDDASLLWLSAYQSIEAGSVVYQLNRKKL